MEWTGHDGEVVAATSPMISPGSGRTSDCGRPCHSRANGCPRWWMPPTNGSSSLRRDDPTAGGLIIATDQQHARGIADLLTRRHRVRPVVAVSEDPDASARIAAFGRSDDPWIVAVRMVSEGVDVPRLRLGVFATTTTTELFFRQAVGRVVRYTSGTPASAPTSSFPTIPACATMPPSWPSSGATASARHGDPTRTSHRPIPTTCR